MTRRRLLQLLGTNILMPLILYQKASALSSVKVTGTTDSKETAMEEWMDAWMRASKATDGTLHLSRFVEPIYFLTKPIGWKPNRNQTSFQPVTVPKGFVTDFASIPRIFWSLLRPDGQYTYPAIIHDFLYWQQKTTRDVADQIFKLGMQEFELSPLMVNTLYQAVHWGGQSAWKENATLKQQGEKRILKQFPDDPKIRWTYWKARADVFEP